MIRKPAQRPTEKTAAPRRPFFIGSWPEPVSRGGIFLSLFGSRKKKVLLGFVTADEILRESMTKSTFHYYLVLQRSWRSMSQERGWDSLRSAEEYCSNATARRAPRPPCSYGVSAALPQRPAELGTPGRKPVALFAGGRRLQDAAPGYLRVSVPLGRATAFRDGADSGYSARSLCCLMGR